MYHNGCHWTGLYTMGYQVMLILTMAKSLSLQHYEINLVSRDPYGDSMSSFPVLGILRCFRSCTTTLDCRSVLYDPSSRQCQMNREHANLGILSSSCGPICPLKYAEKMCSFGASCAADSDCVGNARAMCVGGICACETGYSIHEATCDCVTECSPYGTTYTVLAGTKMSGHNTRRIIGIGLSACTAECTTEQDFTCKTFDYRLNDGTCSLQDYTILDRPTNHIVDSGYDLYVRNCA